MLNLAVLLEDTARETPTRDAVVFNDTRLNYAQINGAANQIANGLVEIGIQPGDRVALSCLNLPYFPMIYYGILKAGATVVPLNVLLKPAEIAYHLKDSGAKAYFCFEGTEQLPMGKMGQAGFAEANDCEHMIVITGNPAAPSPLEGLKTLGQLMHNQAPTFDTVSTEATDTAVILYTSGTTGRPKGAELAHSSLLLNARLADTIFARDPDVDHDVHLIVLPLFHTFGQTAQMNAGFYMQATLVMVTPFEPGAALAAMEKENVTIFAGVPTMYWALLNHPDAEKDYDLDKIAKNLRICSSGGSAMPVETMKAFEEKYHVTILEGYGLSETSPITTFNREGRRKPGSVGEPVWGVNVKLVDADDNEVAQGETGEICVRGHNVMKGYINRPDATEEAMLNGWFHTGDVGRFDEEGFLFIVDRVKDMIIRGGYNVYPREIEEVLTAHPAVSLVAVIGAPHDKYGEEVKAVVVKQPGEEITAEALIKWSKTQLADYKYPRIVEFRDELPMNATGKILKRELRD